MADGMDSGNNRIRIVFGGNVELKQYFARKKNGERCILEIEFIHDVMTNDAVEGRMESIAPEGYEPPAGGDIPEAMKDKNIQPSHKEPVMVEIMSGKAGY